MRTPIHASFHHHPPRWSVHWLARWAAAALAAATLLFTEAAAGVLS